MEKVTKEALLSMKPGDMKVFSVQEVGALNSARSFICQMQNSDEKNEHVSRFETRRDGENLIVRALSYEE